MTKKQSIHPTAIIEEGASIGDNVSIGPYCLIGSKVKIGDNCQLKGHVVISGHTTIDSENTFFPFCSIGAEPQDKTYSGEPAQVIIGKNNIFREYVSIHRGTSKEDLKTIIGENGFFMAYVHIGHDVQVGNNCILANSVNLAGHVRVEDHTIIGGGTNVSQFVRLGKGSYIGGATAVDRDIPLFCTAVGNRVKLKGINIIGLRRQGHSREVISELVDFYRSMEVSALSPRHFVEDENTMHPYKDNPIIQQMVGYITSSKVGLAPFMS